MIIRGRLYFALRETSQEAQTKSFVQRGPRIRKKHSADQMLVENYFDRMGQ